MRVIGIIWTLYPLLGLLAFLEFGIGLAHVFFCLPYAHFYLVFWSGISAGITSVYALLLDYPNKCELLLQFVSMIFAFFLSLISTTEAICLRRVQMKEGQNSFCAGLLNRTTTKQLQCERILGHFQIYLLEKSININTNIYTSSNNNYYYSFNYLQQIIITIKLIISTFIAICAISQFFSGIFLFSYSAKFNRFRLTTSHLNLFFGFSLILLYIIHSNYCCQLYFIYLLPIIGIYSLLFALLPLPPNGHPIRQLFAIIGSGFSIILISLSIFSIFCLLYNPTFKELRGPPFISQERPTFLYMKRKKLKEEIGLLRYCNYPEWLYENCERILDFSFPYLNWNSEQVFQEKIIIKFVINCLLAICSFGLFFLFLIDAFCY
ncbi:hypothetical protein Mgra_00003214 [Meloidogyne graminicola]|uniref:Uncharacterized protein n=1 Tax=Meloidogyne graminicola TaxID=189291 RepID=A0A8S9ZVS1_9BILA|nr:hypothetical protein Mgra_00003214 [Meloidogyne graminicola]